MKVVVAGATGFVGRVTVRTLESRGYSVRTALRAPRTGLTFESVISRPPLVHGPGAKGNLARFCQLARSGWPVPLGGMSNRLGSVVHRTMGVYASLIDRNRRFDGPEIRRWSDGRP